jgi:hypothetical protein
MAMAAKAWKFMTPAKLYSCETILEGLAQDFKDMAAALGQFIQEAHAIVGQRRVARHRHVTPTDQPCIRDRVVWGTKGAGRDPRRAVAGETGDSS